MIYEAKNEISLEKHGYDFADAAEALDGIRWETIDTRQDYGETRTINITFLRGRVVTIICAPQIKSTRIISMRKATIYEEKLFFTQL